MLRSVIEERDNKNKGDQLFLNNCFSILFQRNDK